MYNFRVSIGRSKLQTFWSSLAYVSCLYIFLLANIHFLLNILLVLALVIQVYAIFRKDIIKVHDKSIILIEVEKEKVYMHLNDGSVLCGNIKLQCIWSFLIVFRVLSEKKRIYLPIFFDSVSTRDFRVLSLYCNCFLKLKV